jgi:ABC-type bacteriocin/lantibiotic exporter with double-glycine peptidase domain
MMAWLQTAYGQLHGTVSAVAAVLVLIVGGTAVADGNMPLGDLVAFYALLGILRGQLTAALVTAPIVISGWQSLGRLEEVLDEPSHEPYSGTRSIDFSGLVTVERVEFAYGQDPPVLHGVDFEVRPGETVALLGPNGAGKSTIISLLAGLYAPTRGRLLADGLPFELLDLPAFRRQIGVIQQDPLIFPASVRENIAYGRPEADEDMIMRAAEDAGAAEMIMRLPAKLDEQVGDEGTRLSGGQRQRIALARALLGEPRLIMLDEPTTYLDEAGAMSVLGSLTSKPDAPTILIVSHDPLVKRVADRVLMLRDGLIEDETVNREQPADIGAPEAHR